MIPRFKHYYKKFRPRHHRPTDDDGPQIDRNVEHSNQAAEPKNKPKTKPLVGEVIVATQPRIMDDQTTGSEPDNGSPLHGQEGQFAGAHHFNILHPSFYDNSHRNYNYIMTSQPVLERLRDAGAPEAALDAGARYPPPRCHPGTRATIQEKLYKWLLDLLRKHNMIWLYGPAGVGKSAVAQTFAEAADTQGLLSAAFFFSETRDSHKRANHLRVTPTLAYQLAIHNNHYQRVITERLAGNPSILDASLQVQFQRLIIEPFVLLASQSIRPFGETPHVVVIDGLDECSDEEAQCELVELIKEASQKAHLPLIWLICSRPERHLKSTFSQLEYANVCRREELLIDNEARADVEQFLRARFKEIHLKYYHMIGVDIGSAWPTEDDFRVISGAADGHFVVAATAERFIGDRVAKNPQAQLASLVSMLRGLDAVGVSNPLEALDAFYSRILAKVPEQAWSLVVQVLGLCAHNLDKIKYPGTGKELTNVKHLWLLLRTDQAHFYNAVEVLHSVLDIPPVEDASEKRLTFYHKSFPDYLTNARRSGKFFVSEEQALRYHLACIFYWYNLILQFENSSRVSADEHRHAESMLRAWYGDKLDYELENFKDDVIENIRSRSDIGLWKNSPIDNDFHFDLVDDDGSDMTILPMFLVRDARACSHFVRTEIKDDVDLKLLHHLSLLTNGKLVEPLDITATDPCERMEKKSVRYVIIGKGSKSGLAYIGKDFVNLRGTPWVWQVIWLNSSLPPTEKQISLCQKWDDHITGFSDESNSSSDVEDSDLSESGDTTEDSSQEVEEREVGVDTTEDRQEN